MKLGKVLKTLADKKGISQKTVAKKVGKSCTAINMIFNCIYEPSQDTLKNIAIALNTPVHIIHYMCISDSDVPKQNLELWTRLKPFIEKGLADIYNLKEEEIRL